LPNADGRFKAGFDTFDAYASLWSVMKIYFDALVVTASNVGINSIIAGPPI